MGNFCRCFSSGGSYFCISRLTGLFWPKSGQDKETEVVTSETATEGINVSLADNQTYMPNVLGLPKDMAEAKLKEYNLVMSIETEDYSDNYKADQVMRQDVAEGEVVEKWSTVGVTISKGSDKVDLLHWDWSSFQEKMPRNF